MEANFKFRVLLPLVREILQRHSESNDHVTEGMTIEEITNEVNTSLQLNNTNFIIDPKSLLESITNAQNTTGVALIETFSTDEGKVLIRLAKEIVPHPLSYTSYDISHQPAFQFTNSGSALTSQYQINSGTYTIAQMTHHQIVPNLDQIQQIQSISTIHQFQQPIQIQGVNPIPIQQTQTMPISFPIQSQFDQNHSFIQIQPQYSHLIQSPIPSTISELKEEIKNLKAILKKLQQEHDFFQYCINLCYHPDLLDEETRNMENTVKTLREIQDNIEKRIKSVIKTISSNK